MCLLAALPACSLVTSLSDLASDASSAMDVTSTMDAMEATAGDSASDSDAPGCAGCDDAGICVLACNQNAPMAIATDGTLV